MVCPHQVMYRGPKEEQMGRTCDTFGERRGAYRFVVGKPEGKSLLGGAKLAGEDNIKIFYQFQPLFYPLVCKFEISFLYYIQSLHCPGSDFCQHFVLQEDGFVEKPQCVTSYIVIIIA